MNNTTMIVIGGVLVLSIVGLLFWQSGPEGETQNNPTPTTTTQPTQATQNDSNTIVDIAVDNENFSTLVTALTAADLVDTLSSDGPFTVFAPTNAAFETLPAGTLESLLNDKEALTNVLTYHVVSGEVMANEVVNLTSATTVQGQSVTITVDGSTVMINDATVTTADIEASNGVIHVIDTVLIPE